jgi:proline iminopeptidase
VEWITRDVGRIFPRQWERFVSHIPVSLQEMRIVDAYHSLLFDDDESVCEAAAAEWCVWEEAHVSLMSDHRPDQRFEDPEFRLRFARIVTYYWKHSAFLEDDRLLRNAPTLSTIPGILLHGRYDVSSPLETAWRLHKRWRGSELRVVDGGHGGNQLSDAIIAALNQFRMVAV